MRMLARPIGLGLAARGDIDEVVAWARQARDQGLDSVWVHDSYFERDGVSFTTAIAQAIAADDDGDEAGFRVALGAANPFTRHPVVLAMTGSALDEILPGRFVLGMGTGLPLRLKQMGIPYEPDAAVAAVSTAIDQIRALWAGERLPSATPGLPRSSRCSRRPTGSRSSSPPTARRSSSWPGRRPTATSPDRPSRSRRCAGSSSGCTPRRSTPDATRDRSRPRAISCRWSTRRGARP